MADLFLHLPFARRLRLAEGLHPLASEALVRRPSLVMLGAAIAALPDGEHRSMSWFRRLFSGGGTAARWQKALAGTPGRVPERLVVSLLAGGTPELGTMARLAVGLGVISRTALERQLAPLTATLPAGEREAVERAQARLWLQARVPARLELEWQPLTELLEGEQARRVLAHVDRALQAAHGSSPGEQSLVRWVKRLITDVAPLGAADSASGPLPPPLAVSDQSARALHFDTPRFVERVDAAVELFSTIANRLAAAFTMAAPSLEVVQELLAVDDSLPAPTGAEREAIRAEWMAWRREARSEALTRGRNPRAAFAEDHFGEGELAEGVLAEGLLAEDGDEKRDPSITRVVALAEIAAYADGSGGPAGAEDELLDEMPMPGDPVLAAPAHAPAAKAIESPPELEQRSSLDAPSSQEAQPSTGSTPGVIAASAAVPLEFAQVQNAGTEGAPVEVTPVQTFVVVAADGTGPHVAVSSGDVLHGASPSEAPGQGDVPPLDAAAPGAPSGGMSDDGVMLSGEIFDDASLPEAVPDETSGAVEVPTAVIPPPAGAAIDALTQEAEQQMPPSAAADVPATPHPSDGNGGAPGGVDDSESALAVATVPEPVTFGDATGSQRVGSDPGTPSS